MTAWAFIAVIVWLCRGRGDGHTAVCCIVAARDADAGGFVSVNSDLFDVVVKDPFDQAVRGSGMCPTVPFGLCYDQADTLSRGLESLVVVVSVIRAIIDV